MTDFRASRRRGGAVHRGMVWLLRHQVRWLVEVLTERRVLPPGAHTIELLPTETWPVGEENRGREIRADVVLRLWPGRVPEESSLKLIRASHVIGLILDFQERRDRAKSYVCSSTTPPIRRFSAHRSTWSCSRCTNTLHAGCDGCSRKQLSMQTCVLTPRPIPRSPPIDADGVPRRRCWKRCCTLAAKLDLPLLVDALRALRHFEGNELLICKEMLISQMKEALIMQAQGELDFDDDEDYDFDCVLTKHERETFAYVRGEQAGCRKGLALAVFHVLHLRGIEFDAAFEAEVLACEDDARLRTWPARAMVVSRADELFEPE